MFEHQKPLGKYTVWIDKLLPREYNTMGGRTEQKEENAEKLEPLFEFQGNSFVVNSHNDDCKRLYRALHEDFGISISVSGKRIKVAQCNLVLFYIYQLLCIPKCY